MYLFIQIHIYSLENPLQARNTIARLILQSLFLPWLQRVDASVVKHRLSDPADFLSLYTLWVSCDQLRIEWDAYIKPEVSQHNYTTGKRRDIFDFNHNFASKVFQL